MTSFQRSELGMFVRSTLGFRNNPAGGFIVGGAGTDAVHVHTDQLRGGGWTRKSPYPLGARSHAAGCRAGTSGWAIGGRGPGTGTFGSTGAASYRPDTWTVQPSAISPLLYAAGASMDGQPHVMGGLIAPEITTPAHRFFDGTSWVTGPPMPAGRFLLRSVGADGGIRALGGVATNGQPGQGRTTATHWFFDGIAWATQANYPHSVGGGSFVNSGNPRMFGGTTQEPPAPFVERTTHNIWANDTWVSQPSVPVLFNSAAMHFYFGGSSYGCGVTQNVTQAIKFDGQAWSFVSPLIPPGRASGVGFALAA